MLEHALGTMTLRGRAKTDGDALAAPRVIGFSGGARCRTRTGTSLSGVRILSPMRLPIPPSGQARQANARAAARPAQVAHRAARPARGGFAKRYIRAS